MAVTNTTNNDQVFQKTVTVAPFINTSPAIVEASTVGLLGATKIMIPTYITDATAIALLINTANWDINGGYTGTAITGTYQGQKHYNAEYLFEAVDDNVWIRLIRG